MNNYVRHILSIVFIGMLYLLHAQMPVMDNYLLSPNMASLGEYGDVPVSLHTGIPSITVPLYTGSSGGHSIPVSLSYHGGGVQPDRHPGWVGLGWTLHAGGSIMRVVHGRPDESDHYNVTDYHYMDSWLYKRCLGWFYEIGNGTEYNTNAYQDNGVPPWMNLDIEEVFDSYSSKAGVDDRESDEYIFNVMGLSGKFYYTHDRGWIVSSNQYVKVILDITDSSNFDRVFADNVADSWSYEYRRARSHSINNFKLIDAAGNVYEFGGRDHPEAIEYSVGFFSQDTEEIAATAWHLTRIRYADGRIVKFNYQKKAFVAEMGISESLDVFVKYLGETPGVSMFYNGHMLDGKTYFKGRDFVHGSLVSPSYLSSIDLGVNGIIEFEIAPTDELEYPLKRACSDHYNPLGAHDYHKLVYLQNYNADGTRNVNHIGFLACLDALEWYKLTNIKVKTDRGEILRQFKFTYNDDDPARKGKERLALLSVSEDSGAAYRFEYDNMDKLPAYCSYNIDHWGFYAETGIASELVHPYNGQVTSQRHIWLEDIGVYTAARNPDPQYAMYGTLTKVHYPTGGYTRLVYEPHKYTEKVNANRTSTIALNYESIAGGLRVKEIYAGDGIPGAPEKLVKSYKYYDASQSRNTKSTGILLTDAIYKFGTDNTATYMTIAESKIYTTQSVHGVGINGDGSHVGYTCVSEVYPDGSMSVYRFSAYSDPGCNDIPGLVMTAGIKLFFPYNSYAFRRGSLLWRKDYASDGRLVKNTEYEYKEINRISVLNYKQIYTINEGIQYLDNYRYCVLLDQRIPSRETVTEYDDYGAEHVTVSTMSYNKNYNILKRVEQTTNGKYRTAVDYTYPFDQYETSAVSKKMVDNFILGNVIVESHRRYEDDAWIVTDRTENVYTADNLVAPSEVRYAKGVSSVPLTTSYSYGKYYTPVSSKLSGNSGQTVYVWGYAHNYIVAAINNATVDEVSAVIGDLDSFAATRIPDYGKLSRLQPALPGSLVTIYKYNPGTGMTECLSPDGTCLVYDYDAFGRLSSVRDGDGYLLKSYEYRYSSTH